MDIFTQWGKPLNIRVDNGRPLGDPSRRMIPPLALWLVGIGINVIYNRPRTPQQNSKVERTQGTLAKWTTPSLCYDYKELGDRLERQSHFYNYVFEDRRKGYSTRLERYPQMKHTGTNYSAEDFCFERVTKYLGQFSWKRKVSKAGQITQDHQRIYLGKKYRGQIVEVTLCAQTNQWKIFDQARQHIKTVRSKLSAQRIIELKTGA